MDELQKNLKICLDDCDFLDFGCPDVCLNVFSAELKMCPCQSGCVEGCHYGGCPNYQCPGTSSTLLVINSYSTEKAALFAWGKRKSHVQIPCDMFF